MDQGALAVGGENLLIYTTGAFYFAIFTLVRYALSDIKLKNGGLPLAPGRFLMAALGAVVCTIGFTAAWGGTSAAFAFPFSVGLVLGLIHPVVAAGLMVSCSLLRPWELEGLQALSVIPKLTGGLCAFSWLFHGIRGKTLTVLWNRAAQLFCALAIWILASAMFSGDFDSALQLYNNTFLIASIIFLMIMNIVSDKAGVRAISTTIVISVVGAIAAAIVMTFEKPDFDPATQRLYSFGLLGNSNDLAAMIILAVPLSLVPVWTATREERTWGQILGATTVAGILLPALVLSQSRGAFVGLIISAIILFLARSARPLKGLLLVTFLAPLGFVALSLVNLARQEGDLAGSTQSRLSYLLAGLNMAVHNPIIGVGFGNYPRYFESYAPGGGMEFEWGERTAHSSWVLALAENGFPGFFLFVMLFVVIVRTAWKQRKEFPELLSAVAGYGVTMSFLSHTYMFIPYLLFALVLASAKVPPPPIAASDLVEIPA